MTATAGKKLTTCASYWNFSLRIFWKDWLKQSMTTKYQNDLATVQGDLALTKHCFIYLSTLALLFELVPLQIVT